MKKTTKRLLTGVLASSFALSLNAFALNKENKATETFVSDKYYSQSVPVDFETEETTAVLSAMQVRSAYFDFYQSYGAEKAATVFYNGVALNFVDAFPLIEEGTTFVPLAVFADAIGAETSYIAETHSVSLEYKGDTITFDINDTSFNVNGGAAQELPFATFVANERTMVPVRFITDAFGLGLYWNGTYKQVVAVDMGELKAGIFSDYTKFDALLAMSNMQVSGKNTQVDGSLHYDLSMDGKSGTMSADVSILVNEDLSGADYDMSVAMDFGGFTSDLEASYGAEATATILESLKGFDLNYRYDVDSLEYYVQSALVSELMPILAGVDGSSFGVSANTWFKMSLSDVMSPSEMIMIQSMFGQYSDEIVSNMDEVVDSIMELTRNYDNSEMNFYGATEMILGAVHNSNFEEESGDYGEGITCYNLGAEFSEDGQSLTAGLKVFENSEGVLEAYLISGAFSNDVAMSFVLGQSGDDITFEVDMDASGVSIKGGGDFTVTYTDEVASGVPSGNVMDLVNLF